MIDSIQYRKTLGVVYPMKINLFIYLIALKSIHMGQNELLISIIISFRNLIKLLKSIERDKHESTL